MSNERIARLEEQMWVAINRQNKTDLSLAEFAKDISGLITVTTGQKDTIDLLSKCVFGCVAIVLIAVGGSLVSLVIKSPGEKPGIGSTLFDITPNAAAASAVGGH